MIKFYIVAARTPSIGEGLQRGRNRGMDVWSSGTIDHNATRAARRLNKSSRTLSFVCGKHARRGDCYSKRSRGIHLVVWHAWNPPSRVQTAAGKVTLAMLFAIEKKTKMNADQRM
jgi:hypothetical protein